jgi:hypothetical protein
MSVGAYHSPSPPWFRVKKLVRLEGEHVSADDYLSLEIVLILPHVINYFANRLHGPAEMAASATLTGSPEVESWTDWRVCACHFGPASGPKGSCLFAAGGQKQKTCIEGFSFRGRSQSTTK